ncbi:MAG TPA: type II CAAX endopeptidase family protein [Bryobacteraceae bacterium]|nr:type II CAAX endopeptidase family protein [Bryobacteraceae bacterium]
MTPEPPPPEIIAPPAPAPPAASPPESYPFWGYLDLLAFVTIGLLGLVAESLLLRVLIPAAEIEKIYVLLPAQFLLYGFLLGTLALIFHRYYGRPFWRSLGWIPATVTNSFAASRGVLAAVGVVAGSLLLRTPDIDSPMKKLLSDPKSIVLLAVLGTTLAPMCEEILFRGFLQPLLVRSLGAVGGVLLAAVPFGLLHLQEYGYSWRHALLISLAGASFGWMRQRSGSTRSAAVMHASYNCVFFLLLAMQQAALHGRLAGYAK